MLKELVYIFFRIESLQNYYEQNIEENLNPQNMNDNENSFLNQKMISKTLFALHRTLRENNIDYWMKCLNEEAKKLRSLKDINGYVFVLINSFAANFYQTGKISESVKTNFTKILKIYAEQYNKDLKLKEKNLNVIFSDFKTRIDIAIEIYKKLLDTETELNNLFINFGNENNTSHVKNKIDQSVSNKIFVKLFFKHALRQINVNENLENNQNNSEIKAQIELSLKLLENDEFDFSKLNIFNINSEVTKSLKILFENLISIRNKCLVNHYFKDYMKKTFGYYNIIYKRETKIEAFMEEKLEFICKGSLITKIHFSSSGFSKYFYKIDSETKLLLIYKNLKSHDENQDKPYKKIPITEIKSIDYGLSTINLKKRYKNLTEKNLNSPWLFLSLIMNKRSIDFYFENEETLIKWYYGFTYFIKVNKLDNIISIPTTSQFVLRKYKLKMINRLKEISDGDKNVNKSLLILTQLKNYIIYNEMGFHSLTFVQVFLLYKKILEKQK